MKTFRYFLITLFLLALVAACKKKESTPEPDRTALLTAKPWKIERILVNGSPVTPATIQSVLGSSALLGQLTTSDIIFRTDGTFTATNRTNAQKTEGTWSFKENNTKLRLDAAAQGYDFTIALISGKNLNISTPYTYSVGGFPITVTADFELVPA